MFIHCQYCGSRVMPQDRTCMKCGAPPPVVSEEIETWGEWVEGVRALTVFMARERPDSVVVTSSLAVRRFGEVRRLPAGQTSLRWDVPRRGVLSYIEVHAAGAHVIGRAQMVADGCNLIFDFPCVELPLSLNLNVDMGKVVCLELRLEVPPSPVERTFHIFRRILELMG